MEKKYLPLTNENFISQNPITILRISLSSIIKHPAILFPTITLGFIQLLALQILYFSPQKPIVYFLGPLITSVWSEEFLHYPKNLILLPKIFYYVQILIYLFIGTFLLAVTSKIITILNDHPRVNLKLVFKEVFSLYVHIFFASAIAFILFQLLTSSYIKLIEFLIKAEPFKSNLNFWNKTFVLSIPYFQFTLGIVASTLLIYTIPIIVNEKKKVFIAFIQNFKILSRSFITSLVIVGLPTLLYLPILALRNNIPFLMNAISPEIQIIAIILGLISSMFIDLLIMVSATTLYLFIKENT